MDWASISTVCRVTRSVSAASLLAALLVAAIPASGAALYVEIPGIHGEQATPGHPDAIFVQSLTIAPHQFTVIKNIDSASSAIAGAVARGTMFPLASALVYSATPGASPDANLTFANVLATSYQVLPGTYEQAIFASANPGSIFLELPGIVGESSTPGHPGVVRIDSVTLTATEFSVAKPIDSVSPALLSAVANGTLFTKARFLFYNAANPTGPPDGVLLFGTVLPNAYQTVGAAEKVNFSFATVEQQPTGMPVISIFALPSQVNEGGTAAFHVIASPDTVRPVAVGYSMSGKAAFGADYSLSGGLGQSGQIIIPLGSDAVSITLTAVADHVAEKKETAVMTLQRGGDYKLKRAKKAKVTVINAP